MRSRFILFIYIYYLPFISSYSDLVGEVVMFNVICEIWPS